MALKLDDKPGHQYDDDFGTYDPQKTPAGDPSDPRASASTLYDQESAGATTKDDYANNESAMLSDRIGSGYSANTKDTFRNLKGKITKKRGIAGIIIGGLVGGGIFGFSIIQGPMQFIHFSQLLQRFHFSRTEIFGNDRTTKVMLYALLGKGAERGRLGVLANKAADKWEQRLLNESGLRPVYDKTTRRFVGFEIVNQDKFREFLGDINERNNARLERVMGRGAEITQAGNRVTRGGNASGSDDIPANARIVNLRNVSSRDRRIAIRAIGQTTHTNKVVSGIGSRLLKKRGGVSFSWLNPVRDVTDRAELRRGILKEWAKKTKNGVNSKISNVGKLADENTKQQLDRLNEAGTDPPEPGGGETVKNLRTILARSAGPALAAGAICTAKSFGDDIPEYKYTNNVLPMMRMGTAILSMGDQVRSNKNLSLEELSVYSELLYDNETRTSWASARSIQGELGEEMTGPDLPTEAQLKNINDKPKLFDIIDSIPGIGPVCGAYNAIGSIVPGFVSDITGFFVNLPLGVFGTSTEELTEQALAAVAGQSVDPFAKGAEFGNLVNVGAFMAGNDHAISMGGAPLTTQQVATLKTEQQEIEKHTKTIAQRYFDPYEANSLFGKIIWSIPTNFSQLTSSFSNPFKNLGNIFSSTSNTVTAQTVGGYDYGVPRYGFSLEEQLDPRFEDPYENAAWVEPRLEELNNEYGECFGIKIIISDAGISLENGATVNVFKTPDKCKQNGDETFLRYRFYIADTIAALSMACFEGDDEACSQLDANTSTATGNGASEGASGSANLRETIVVDKPGKFITMPARYSCSGRTTQIDSRIAPALAYLINTYNLCADDGLANGHKSHGAGLGVDLRPRGDNNSKEVWKNTIERAARDMGWWGDAADEGKSSKGCAYYSGYGQCMHVVYPDKIPKWVRWIGYNGDVDHGDPWHVFGSSYAHIHIGWDTPNGDGLAGSIIPTPRASVYTFPAPIPDDLKELL